MVGAGLLFLIMGMIFSAAKPTQVKASEIGITASNMVFDGTDYYLDLYQMQTPVQINTMPLASNTPIYLSVSGGPNYIKVSSKVNNGGYAIIELITSGGKLAYGEQAVINVACGRLPLMKIFVTISLPEEHGEIVTSLLRGNLYADNLSLASGGAVAYCLYVGLRVFGNTVTPTQGFEFTETSVIPSTVTFQKPLSPSTQQWNITVGDPYPTGTYQFLIQCEYLGVTFSTFYTLTIVN